ncbi:MAG: TrkH family potassium uptake protein [Christensenellales bacterium]
MIKKLSGAQVIVLGVLTIILLGACLLSLPVSSRAGEATPFVNALFTATSATCVTGLVVYDTYSYWSLFGQIVIIILIQIGGLGFMSFAAIMAFILRRRIGLRERGLMQDSYSVDHIGGIVRLVRRILWGTLLFEGLGAFLLAFRFCPEIGFGKGIFTSIFVSISAFCNAGFDVMGYNGPFTSIVPYSGDWLVCLVIMSLIVIGGIGFIVWDDLYTHKFRFSKYKLHTKIVLSVTAVLIFASAAIFFFLEANHSMAGQPVGERVLNSLFQSVTCRTAGFNSISQTAMTEPSAFLSMLLMFIGASPGSTGGGIKTTTLLVLLAVMISTIKRQKETTAFGRKLKEDLLRKAHTVFLMYAILVVIAIVIISAVDPFSLKDTAYDVFSAIGTVGLSMGITPFLSTVSRLVLSFLMYFGRVGALTLGIALAWAYKPVPVSLPAEEISIG